MTVAFEGITNFEFPTHFLVVLSLLYLQRPIWMCLNLTNMAQGQKYYEVATLLLARHSVPKVIAAKIVSQAAVCCVQECFDHWEELEEAPKWGDLWKMTTEDGVRASKEQHDMAVAGLFLPDHG